MLDLLLVAEFRVPKASRRFSMLVSLSIVFSKFKKIGLRTSSKVSSLSAKVNRIACITIPRTEGVGSRRYVYSTGLGEAIRASTIEQRLPEAVVGKSRAQ